ncbi:hypothetical protein [Streptomyces sp. NPDC006132]|uniref:hypothetical protein n=1 Tax=Streptomyces sp. NPDC006132 TaxID=3156732 RepID=UPI00340EC1A1
MTRVVRDGLSDIMSIPLSGGSRPQFAAIERLLRQRLASLIPAPLRPRRSRPLRPRRHAGGRTKAARVRPLAF